MKRHPAFQDLSRDHFVALNRCLQVVRAIEGHPSARPLDLVLEEFRHLWEGDGLRAHFLEEETDLVPLLHKYGAGDLAQRLMDEHADIRRGFHELSSGKHDQALATAKGLTAHARWEEDTVFEWLQQNLSEPQLAALLEQSRGFRAANGLPVNPPKA